jgi:hypothetical protein
MIRPRLAISTMLAALALTLTFTGAAAALPAGQFQTNVLRNLCPETGGMNGHGYLLLRVKVREMGMSGANYFVIKSSMQEPLTGGSWRNVSKWPKETSTNFPDNGTSYYRVVERRYDYTPDDFYYRIQMKVQFWSNSHGLLMTKTVNGCS